MATEDTRLTKGPRSALQWCSESASGTTRTCRTALYRRRMPSFHIEGPLQIAVHAPVVVEQSYAVRRAPLPYSVPNDPLCAQNAFIPYRTTSIFGGIAPVHAERPDRPQCVPLQPRRLPLLRAERLSIHAECLHSLPNDYTICRGCTNPH